MIRNATKLYRGMKAHHGVSLMFEGKTVTNIDGREGVQVPGTLQLKEPGQIHRDLSGGSPGTFQLVSFDAGLVEAAGMAFGLGARAGLTAVQIAPGDSRALSLPLIGFCDQSQMHRHFVRIVGCTPGAYARR